MIFRFSTSSTKGGIPSQQTSLQDEPETYLLTLHRMEEYVLAAARRKPKKIR